MAQKQKLSILSNKEKQKKTSLIVTGPQEPSFVKFEGVNHPDKNIDFQEYLKKAPLQMA